MPAAPVGSELLEGQAGQGLQAGEEHPAPVVGVLAVEAVVVEEGLV